MSVASGAVLMGRKWAESLMESEGVVRRATGATEPDPVTFEAVPVFETVYTGKGKLRLPDSLATNAAAVPGAMVTAVESYLSLPVSAASANVRPGDIWETTANPLDEALVGQKVRITRPHSQTYATARRFPVSADV